jgi:hypothetical protein
MSYPPSPLNTSYANATATENLHPAAHNLEGAAINDIVEVLGQAPQAGYTDVQDRQSAIEQGASDYFDRKLFGWRRALYERDRTRAVILAGPGDSRTEGEGVASIDERWLNILGRELDARYPTEGYKFTQGYIPAWYAMSVQPTEAPVGAGNYNDISSSGFGLRSSRLRASSGSGVGQKTFTVEGDNAWFYYTTYGSMGKSEYQIDGGAFVEVDHNIAFFTNFVSARREVSLGSPGTHTIVWRFKSTGGGIAPDPIIEGIEAFEGDADLGVSVIDCGHGGFTVANLMAAPTMVTQWVSLPGSTLCVIDVGTNNWNQSTQAGIDTALATYEADMTTMLGLLAAGDPLVEVELCGGWTPRSGTTAYPNPDPAQWQLFVNVQYGLADTVDNVSLFDYTRMLPQPDAPGDTDGVTGGFYSFLGIHPEEAGHAAIGTALVEHLSLPAGGAWSAPEPGLAVLDLTDHIIDITADPIDLGTDGQCFLYYRLADGVLTGWLFMAVDSDASFPNSGMPICVDPDFLPAVPATPPTAPFGNFVWPGSFGFATDSATFEFAAIPTVINGGFMAFILAESAGGLAALWSDTNPEALAAVQTIFQGGVRYPTETGPATGS